MRAYHLDLSTVGALAVRRHEVPTPGAGEVLVRVGATALNYRDLLLREGRYPVPARPGVIPLSDGAGTVVAAGDGVDRVRVGDRVCSTYFPDHVDGPPVRSMMARQLGASEDGMLAEYRVLPASWLVRIPDSVTVQDAATLPCAGLTAWSALHGPRPVAVGQTVLVLGTGGVALAAVQLAVALGARVVGATSGEAKVELLRRLGATHVIDYQARRDWHTELLELTDGRGVEHVVETVGPATLERSIRSTAFDGHIAMIGVFDGPDVRFDPRVFQGRLLTIRRIAVGSRAGLEALLGFVAERDVRPVIDRVFEFEAAVEAYGYVAARRHVGKVLITC